MEVRVWMGPRKCLDYMDERIFLTLLRLEPRPLIVQSLTDCAIPPPHDVVTVSMKYESILPMHNICGYGFGAWSIKLGASTHSR
jgi:hypothetical protein